MTLGYSRRGFALGFMHERMQDLLAAHATSRDRSTADVPVIAGRLPWRWREVRAAAPGPCWGCTLNCARPASTGCEAAFAHFGERCEFLLYDRMRTVVLGTSEGRARLNPTFASFALTSRSP